MTNTEKILEDEKGSCCVCNKYTKLYCGSCCEKNDDGSKSPVCYFCEEHYESVVMTGNCCSGNERLYN